MKSIIRWGIIGCGDVTEIKSGPGFQKSSGSELVAVMRRTGTLAKDYAERHNVPKWYDNADKLINDPDVDAVYIATPPSSHKKFTLAAAAAGKPVYVEKPMALNYRECVEMIDACKNNKVPLFVAYYRRALPRFLKIKSLIDQKAIGEIRSVNIRFYQTPTEKDLTNGENWRVDPAIAGCGYFCDLGSHMIDLLQFYFGKIVSASGFHSNRAGLYSAEDTVNAIFSFENGLNGTAAWCFVADENTDQTEIIGSKGRIIYPTFSSDPVILVSGGKKEEIKIDNPEHVAQPLIQLIVDELLGKGKSPSNGKSAASTAWTMDKILGKL
ncbi:MAG TPA: Gfo/Idh/MocA family oxidoreductase [Melioribacteraceae bacterium]|nr:Gfo/Idh/MocA family oxidoreductase [Melioribacteraceae bacterium]